MSQCFGVVGIYVYICASNIVRECVRAFFYLYMIICEDVIAV